VGSPDSGRRSGHESESLRRLDVIGGSRAERTPVDFAWVVQQFLESSSADSRPTELAKNDILYTSGERSRGIFFVESGAVKTVSHSQAGKDCLLDIYVAGDLLGESSLVNRTRAETAVAMMATQVRHISTDQFMEYVLSIGKMHDWDC
jgi:CRP-like cAMP-binding protein